MVTMVLQRTIMQKKIGSIQLLMLILFSCLGVYCFGQKPIVGLSCSSKEVAPDETVVFRVSTNVEGTINIDFPTEFEVDYGVLHQVSQEMDPSGKIKTYYITQNSGSFNKSGSYTIFATVSYKGKPYKSNKITIEVDESKAGNLALRSKDPVFGYIEAKKTSVYEGECVMLNARVVSRYPILNVEGYDPYKCDKNAEEHPFNYSRELVEETKLNGKKVQTFEYGKQLLIPIATGKCRIKPFEMALLCHGNIFDRTIQFKSTGLTLNVKPLPKGAPSDFIGAVGIFDLAQEISDISKLKAGDVFQVKLTVNGTGNLHNIQDPKIKIPNGCKLYGDPEREESYDYTESGVTGTITFVYNIQILQEGELHFDAPSISYFDPRKEKYITVSTEPFTLLLGKEKTSLRKDKVDSSKKDTKEVIVQANQAKKKKQEKSSMPLILGIAVPGATCALFFLFLMARRKRSKQEHDVALAKERYEEKMEQMANTDFWQEVLANPTDSNNLSINLPKAIIQILEKRFGLQNTSRERVLSEFGTSDKDGEREIRDIISVCDHFRYGFGVQEFPSTKLLERVRNILKV